jgi:hypothetical protein
VAPGMVAEVPFRPLPAATPSTAALAAGASGPPPSRQLDNFLGLAPEHMPDLGPAVDHMPDGGLALDHMPDRGLITPPMVVAGGRLMVLLGSRIMALIGAV